MLAKFSNTVITNNLFYYLLLTRLIITNKTFKL